MKEKGCAPPTAKNTRSFFFLRVATQGGMKKGDLSPMAPFSTVKMYSNFNGTRKSKESSTLTPPCVDTQHYSVKREEMDQSKTDKGHLGMHGHKEFVTKDLPPPLTRGVLYYHFVLRSTSVHCRECLQGKAGINPKETKPKLILPPL